MSDIHNMSQGTLGSGQSKIFGNTYTMFILVDSPKHLKSINIHIVILARILQGKRTHLLAFYGSQIDTEAKN